MNIEPKQPGTKKNAIMAFSGIVVALLLKFKFALLFGFKLLGLIKIGWIFSSFGSLFISFGFYTMLFGWPFAVTIIALLYIHEMGHYVWMKALHLNPKAPVFVPGLGAYVAMTNMPATQKDSAWVAMAGPLVGGVASAMAYYWGIKTDNQWLMKSGSTGFFLNLFQLIPAKPFDGGFIAQALSKWILIPGTLTLIFISFVFHSVFLLIISLVSIFQIVTLFRPQAISTMQPASLSEKTLITIAYLSVTGMLGYLFYLSNY